MKFSIVIHDGQPKDGFKGGGPTRISYLYSYNNLESILITNRLIVLMGSSEKSRLCLDLFDFFFIIFSTTCINKCRY